MKLVRNRTATLVVVALILLQVNVWAEDSKSKTVQRSKNNINFNLPDDWPIEEKDGTVGPVPIEEYLAVKFEATNDRLVKLEKTIALLEAKTKILEEQLKRPRKLREGELQSYESETNSKENTY